MQVTVNRDTLYNILRYTAQQRGAYQRMEFSPSQYLDIEHESRRLAEILAAFQSAENITIEV